MKGKSKLFSYYYYAYERKCLCHFYCYLITDGRYDYYDGDDVVVIDGIVCSHRCQKFVINDGIITC